MQQAAATHLEQFPWNHQQQQHRHQAVESISWDGMNENWMPPKFSVEFTVHVHWKCEFLIPCWKGGAAPLNSWTGLGDMFLRWMSQVLRRFYIPILLNRENHQFCILEFLQQIIFYSFSVILFSMFVHWQSLRCVDRGTVSSLRNETTNATFSQCNKL